MRRKVRYPWLLLMLLSGCQASGPRTPEDTGEMPYGKIGFVFFTPRALPALVTKALIIDTEKVVYTFRTLDSTKENPGSVGSWSSKVSRHAQFNKISHPPALMLFCWDSVIDKKTYETSITFSPALRETMSVSTGKDWRGKTAWYKTLLFGLAPGGKVRIWLQNSDVVDNLPVEPVRITTLSGDKLDACKGITQHPNGYVYYGETPEFIKGKTYPYGNW